MGLAVVSPLRRLAGIEAELRRRTYAQDPVLWAQERLDAHVWSKQRDIMRSVRDHRKTAVRSCHGPGKSFIAARIVAWWLDIHPPGQAFVVTSAPTGRQVRAILWREIGRAHATGSLLGRTNQTEWHMPSEVTGKEELVAFGQKPADMDPSAFVGIHAAALLVVFDEADGMPKLLWPAATSLMTNEECRFLAIGNPDDPTTEFADVCKPGSGWNVIGISVFDTPNFTGEMVPPAVRRVLVDHSWVEDHRRRWAPSWRWNEERTKVVPPAGKPTELALKEADPYWSSKVLGLYPAKGGPLSLIPAPWIEAAQERERPVALPSEFGVDVGAGGDSSTVAHRQGARVRVIHEDHNPNTMQTLGLVVALRRQAMEAGPSPAVKVDKVGIGTGIVDRANEAGEGFLGVNVGLPAHCAGCLTKSEHRGCEREKFVNLRAQLWWALRQRFEDGAIDLDPADEELAAELSQMRYLRTSRGQIQIESKDDAKKRGVRSPNRADAVMLAFADMGMLTAEAPPRKRAGVLF